MKNIIRREYDALIILLFLAVIVVSYYIYRFIEVLFQMKQPVLFPISEKELETVRREQSRPLNAATYREQKNGIIFHIILFIYQVSIFVVIWIFQTEITILVIPLILYPIFNSPQLLNLFVITKNGIIVGARYTPWRRLESFTLERISIHHKFYGDPAVNDKILLKMKTKIRSYNCFVLNDAAKEKLVEILQNHDLIQEVDANRIVDKELEKIGGRK